MSFKIDPATGQVDMTSGDTGAIVMIAKRTDGEPWGEDDRAIFTLKGASGEEILYRIYPMEISGDTGVYVIQFANADTDNLSRGSYLWDVRYVVDPVYSDDGERIIDGDQVVTPMQNMVFNVTKAQVEV